jgi:hypothetical protein
MHCTLCQHSRRGDIEADIRAAQVSRWELGQRYGLTVGAINYHARAHMGLAQGQGMYPHRARGCKVCLDSRRLTIEYQIIEYIETPGASGWTAIGARYGLPGWPGGQMLQTTSATGHSAHRLRQCPGQPMPAR